MGKHKIHLKVSKSDPDVAYLYLPDHPINIVHGVVDKQIRLSDLIDNYKGPDIYLDIDHENTLIGIEILS